jgi:hypothetical protein
LSLLAASVDYTSKDFDSLRLRLISLVKSVFPEWSDFEVAGFGNLLLEMYAFVGDVLLFYQDNQARESRLATSTQRKNVITLTKMLGYTLYGAGAATVELTLSIASAQTSAVRFRAGAIARTKEVTDPVKFQLLSDAAIAAGSTSVTVKAENTVTHSQQFDSTGLASFEIYLDYTPYLDGSVVVSTSQGTFSQVDDFLDSAATALHFTVTVDQNDRALLRFGNGVNGAAPTGTVSVTYKTGGGSAGKVDANTVTVLEGTFVTDAGQAVQVSVTNPVKSEGGYDRQTIESARALAPKALRATNRCVSPDDFEIHACELAGVARALMLTSDDDGSIDENAGNLYIVPTGGGTPTAALLAAVKIQVTVTYPCTLTFQVNALAPLYKAINIVARVYLRVGYTESAVGATIRAALAAFFQITNDDGSPNTNVDFGFNMKDEDGEPSNELSWSDLFNVVRDCSGVRKIGSDKSDFLLNGNAADVAIGNREFPVLGTIKLINGATGGEF